MQKVEFVVTFVLAFLDELGQRDMIEAISKSASSYSSGLKCWAAFCDALGVRVQFPASEQLVIRFSASFHNKSTLQQYLKHLRWAHRFLRMENAWHTDSVKQVVRGGAKRQATRPVKVAVDSKQVR